MSLGKRSAKFLLLLKTQKNAYRIVKEELINMYWNMERLVSEEVRKALYGKTFIDELQS